MARISPINLPALEPLGDTGWLAHWPTEDQAARWASLVRGWGRREILEVVTAYQSVAVICDPAMPESAWHGLEAGLNESLTAPYIYDTSADDLMPDDRLEVPVVYDGPDLADVAQRLGLNMAEVVQAHTGQDYRVYAVGFLPGFPYAGYLPERISGLPRRMSPRSRVLAGSVAIAGRQTGIYPAQSPGGWHLLGRTGLTICDLKRGFFQFRPGMKVRFVATAGGVMP